MSETSVNYLERLRDTAADIERMLTTWPDDKRDGNYRAHADDAAAYRWAADEIERLRREVYLLRNERDNLADNLHRLITPPPMGSGANVAQMESSFDFVRITCANCGKTKDRHPNKKCDSWQGHLS